MQPRDRSFGLGAYATSDSSDESSSDPSSNTPESIRDLQRRRRDAARMRADLHAILATPDEDEDEEDDQPGMPRPAPAKVWIVFRGQTWSDSTGTLRESDTILGIFGTEDGARRAAAALNK